MGILRWFKLRKVKKLRAVSQNKRQALISANILLAGERLRREAECIRMGTTRCAVSGGVCATDECVHFDCGYVPATASIYCWVGEYFPSPGKVVLPSCKLWRSNDGK